MLVKNIRGGSVICSYFFMEDNSGAKLRITTQIYSKQALNNACGTWFNSCYALLWFYFYSTQ